ncbi:hypothetical protein A2U01_0076507 [Trifolium medium]|uniref:Uncharacterized protein n=1 Tax=Trifolium medium TaxID=97028 RepID=A0A392T4E8_9FABA|nr:hypothetical protein [Trifolium medium]
MEVEQLERVRKRRWRKGFEESHGVALWKDGWMQGSLDVGMLRG